MRGRQGSLWQSEGEEVRRRAIIVTAGVFIFLFFFPAHISCIVKHQHQKVGHQVYRVRRVVRVHNVRTLATCRVSRGIVYVSRVPRSQDT
ncbi:hypothetical protein LY78DRAFT_407906 [Colletotrichum sublineola]|nr:hypothetical protein LY78DRAFT_407906 [Colletotrichum sublineola]